MGILSFAKKFKGSSLFNRPRPRGAGFPCELDERGLLELQETIEKNGGFVMLQGEKLTKYEKRMADLKRIFQQTAPVPYAEPHKTWNSFYGDRVHVRGETSFARCVELLDSLSNYGTDAESEVGEPVAVDGFALEASCSSSLDEPLISPTPRYDFPNRLEATVSGCFVPKKGGIGLIGDTLPSKLSKASSRKGATTLSVFLQTQSVADSSDFNGGEFQTPLSPRNSDKSSTELETNAAATTRERYGKTILSQNFPRKTKTFKDMETMNVTGSMEYDVQITQRPSMPQVSSDLMLEELEFATDTFEEDLLRKHVSLESIYMEEMGETNIQKQAREALFAATEIRATSDTVYSKLENDFLTRLVPGKIDTRTTRNGVIPEESRLV